MKIIETKKDYPVYYEKIFGVEPSAIPNQVFIIENDTHVIGFVSGHKNFDGLFLGVVIAPVKFYIFSCTVFHVAKCCNKMVVSAGRS